MENIIEVKELSKFFGSLKAVDHITFEVHSNEIFGLLGPNGAGKTTTIKMICGMLQPTSGTAIVSGHDVRREPQEVKRRIGLVPDVSNLFGELSGRVNLDFMGKLYGLDRKTRSKRIDEVLELFQLKARQHDRIRYYSKGMHRRLTIAAAILHEPQILIMDEPTSGLDAQTARLVREIILDINKQGRTILLTTHQIEEADRLVHRVGIIDRGHIIALDMPEKIKERTEGTRALDIRLLDESNPQRWIPLFTEVKEVDNAVLIGDRIRILSKDLPTTIPAVVETVARGGGRIEDICVSQPSLEDAFISLTGKTIREEALSKEEYVKQRMSRSGLR